MARNKKPGTRAPGSAPGMPPAADAGVIADTGTAASVAPVFTLGPALTINTAEALRTELLALLGSGGDVSIDGAGVEAVDTAGMQVLLAFRRALEKGNRRLEWLGCSPALAEVSGLLGLQTQVGLTAQISAVGGVGK